MFVVGKSGTLFDETVLRESREYGHILQGDFPDTPHEDTRKFMLAADWLARSADAGCPQRFVARTADNIYHNMVAISGWLYAKHHLAVAAREEDLYTGLLLRGDRPIRNAADPLFVPLDDYPKETFPDFVRSPVYVFAHRTLVSMSRAMATVTPIAMEDAYVGLLAARVGVSPLNNDHFQMIVKTKDVCHWLRMFFVYGVRPSEQLAIFLQIRKARKSRQCRNASWIDGRMVKNRIEV